MDFFAIVACYIWLSVFLLAIYAAVSAYLEAKRIDRETQLIVDEILREEHEYFQRVEEREMYEHVQRMTQLQSISEDWIQRTLEDRIAFLRKQLHEKVNWKKDGF